jgi:hypothetical protein
LSGSKQCYRCRRERPVSDFIEKKNGKTYGMCSPCLSDILTAPREGKKVRLQHTAAERICYLCK